MKKFAFTFIYFILVQSSAFSQSAEEYFEKGNFMFQLGKFDRALDFYNKAIQLKSDYIDAYYGRAKTYYVQADFSDAIEDYNKIIELKPDDVSVLNERGKIYTFLKLYDEGFRDFDKVLEIDPQNSDAYYLRGSAYFFFLNNNNKAKEDIKRAVELNPKLKEAYNLLANIYMGNTLNLVLQKVKEGSNETAPQNFLTDSLKMELNEALQYASIATSIDSTYPSPYVTRGGIYFAIGEYESSVKEYEKALKLNLIPVEKKIAMLNLDIAKSMLKK